MAVKTLPEAKTGESIIAGLTKLDVNKLTPLDYSDLCDNFVEEIKLDDEVQAELARLFVRQILASYWSRTLESIYNFNFAVRYMIDPGYTHEDLMSEIKSRHTFSTALQHCNMVYNLLEHEGMKSRMAEVIVALKVVIADKEKKA